MARAMTTAALLISLSLAGEAIAAPTCKPPSNNDWTAWLKAQEAAGGHTMACHLGISVSGLIQRLNSPGTVTGNCQAGTAASSWSSPSTLLSVVKPVVQTNWATVNGGPAGNQVNTGSGITTLGTTVTAYTGKPGKNRSPCPSNNGYVCSAAKGWTVILQKTAGGDCILLTAYPS